MAEKLNNILLVIFCAVALISCGESPFFEENKSVGDNVWSWNEPVEFDVDVTDTVSPYNFYLNLRTTKGYEFSNVFVFFTLKFPNGGEMRDTIEAPLADDLGNWLGKPSGSLVDNKILFGPRRIFPLTGKYHVTIEQAMRDQDLAEVSDVGLTIEKSKK
jgi:gliding motility-associated lipoprotein GldH